MENSSLFELLFNSIEFPLVLAFLLIGVFIGMMFIWLVWRGKVNNLEKQLETEKALTVQYESQLKADDEEMAMKESDLKKATLEAVKLRQELQKINDENAVTQNEAQVIRTHTDKLKVENQDLTKKIEHLDTLVTGLKEQNTKLTSQVEQNNSSKTNVEVYTLKTKLTKINSELTSSLLQVKRLENNIEILKKENAGLKATQKNINQSGVPKTVSSKKKTIQKSADSDTTLKEKATPVSTQDKASKEHNTASEKQVSKKSKTSKKEKVTVKKTIREDLKKIEGIGPKIEQLLNAAGILNWKDLAKAKPSTLRTILSDAGNRYKMHNPTSWPEQSALAAKGEWDKLKTLQDFLKKGKKTTA